MYKGVTVRELLLQTMGQKEEDLVGKGLHLIAISYDADFQGKCYEVSIPIEAALDPINEVTLAYEMNGADIPAVHGYPVRLICPGYIGVRSAKWVNKLIISKDIGRSLSQANEAVPDSLELRGVAKSRILENIPNNSREFLH